MTVDVDFWQLVGFAVSLLGGFATIIFTAGKLIAGQFERRTWSARRCSASWCGRICSRTTAWATWPSSWRFTASRFAWAATRPAPASTRRWQLLNKSTVEVGSNLKYAATHQFGRGNIPPRPFLGLSDQDKRKIDAIIRSWAAELGFK